jgi:hypothetical protein
LATSKPGVVVGIIGFCLRGEKEVIEEARSLLLGDYRLTRSWSMPYLDSREVSQRGGSYPDKWPCQQVAQCALVDDRAQGMLVVLLASAIGLHRLVDDQIGLNGIVQRG